MAGWAEWDGTAAAPITLAGVWDGAQLTPVTSYHEVTAGSSVFGQATYPGTPARGDDGPVRVASAFYVTDAGHTLTAARLYVPAGLELTGPVTFAVHGPTPTPDLGAAPLASGSLSAVVAGWNDAPLSPAVELTPSAYYWLSYRASSGQYLAFTLPSQAGYGSGPLYMADDVEVQGRGRFLYDGGSVQPAAAAWGLDAVVS